MLKWMNLILLWLVTNSAWAIDFDQALEELSVIRSSDIVLMEQKAKALNEMMGDMNQEQKCLLRFYQQLSLFYQADYHQSVQSGLDTLSSCRSQTGGALAMMQNAHAHSVMGEFKESFEALHAAEAIKKKINLKPVYLKQYLSASIQIHQNLSRHQVASSLIEELALLDDSDMYQCRVLMYQLNNAVGSEQYDHIDDRDLINVVRKCSDANESIFLFYSQIIWYVSQIKKKGPRDGHPHDFLNGLEQLEAEVNKVNYPFLTLAFNATMAMAYEFKGEDEKAHVYALKSQEHESVSDVYFRMMAQEVIINYHKKREDHQQAFEALELFHELKSNKLADLDSKDMAYELVKHAVDAKENAIQLLKQKNEVLSKNEVLQANRDQLKFYLILSLSLSLVLLLIMVQRMWRQLSLAKKEAESDFLTGIYNRTGMKKKVDQLFNEHQVIHSEVQFALIDLDDFNRLNEEVGHDAGDFVLIQFVDRVQALLPEGAFWSRVSGDGFCLVWVNSSVEDMRAFLEQIRSNIQNHQFKYHEQKLLITASFGFTSAQPGFTGFAKLWTQADKAMIMAKREGKNKVVYVAPE